MRVRPYCSGYQNGCQCPTCDDRRQFEEHEYQMYLAQYEEQYRMHLADEQAQQEELARRRQEVKDSLDEPF